MTELEIMGEKAKKAAKLLIGAGKKKTEALLFAADELQRRSAEIISANEIDYKAAKENGMSPSLLDRLRMTEERVSSMAEGIRLVANTADPVGKVLDGSIRPNGLKIERVSVPIGVIGIIYEARPNVTGDAAALCLKAGNAVILRGGKEAINTNIVTAEIIRDAIAQKGLDENSVQLIKDTSRASATELMGLVSYLDLLIPRGGAGLIKSVVENSKVPVIETGVGNCHVYVDESAELNMAADIIFNAKTSRPSVCNAIETILINENIAEKALPLIKEKLDTKSVTIYGDERTREIIKAEEATEEDWYKEYLDFSIACKIVPDTDAAIDHIAKYSSHHSECIVTRSYENAEKFTALVDSAAVYVNASTRFTDGGEFGLGAEIGISTQKLHARGPMGLNQLVSYKYIIRGNGQIR